LTRYAHGDCLYGQMTRDAGEVCELPHTAGPKNRPDFGASANAAVALPLHNTERSARSGGGSRERLRACPCRTTHYLNRFPEMLVALPLGI
jgi:hypothetical protein